jgi:acyl carrier protein
VIPESAALRCGVRARILEELLRVPGYDWGRLGTTHGAVVTVIGDHYGLYGRGLPLDTDLVADLGSDEVDKLEVLMTIEELFDVRFDQAARAAVRTVGDVVELVRSALAQRPSSQDPVMP